MSVSGQMHNQRLFFLCRASYPKLLQLARKARFLVLLVGLLPSFVVTAVVSGLPALLLLHGLFVLRRRRRRGRRCSRRRRWRRRRRQRGRRWTLLVEVLWHLNSCVHLANEEGKGAAESAAGACRLRLRRRRSAHTTPSCTHHNEGAGVLRRLVRPVADSGRHHLGSSRFPWRGLCVLCALGTFRLGRRLGLAGCGFPGNSRRGLWLGLCRRCVRVAVRLLPVALRFWRHVPKVAVRHCRVQRLGFDLAVARAACQDGAAREHHTRGPGHSKATGAPLTSRLARTLFVSLFFQ